MPPNEALFSLNIVVSMGLDILTDTAVRVLICKLSETDSVSTIIYKKQMKSY